MKQIISTFIITLYAVSIFAQSKIEIKEQTEDIGGGNHNALVVKIFQSKDEIVLKEWKTIMKDFDAKILQKKELFADNALIKDMSENTVDLYAKTEMNADGDVLFTVGVDLGGAYLTSSQHPKEFKAIKRIITDFAKDLSEKGFKEKVKLEEKALITLTKQKEFMNKENETMQRDIELYKEKIIKAEESIKANMEANILKDKEIIDQKKLLEGVIKKSDVR